MRFSFAKDQFSRSTSDSIHARTGFQHTVPQRQMFHASKEQRLTEVVVASKQMCEVQRPTLTDIEIQELFSNVMRAIDGIGIDLIKQE